MTIQGNADTVYSHSSEYVPDDPAAVLRHVRELRVRQEIEEICVRDPRVRLLRLPVLARDLESLGKVRGLNAYSSALCSSPGGSANYRLASQQDPLPVNEV